MHLLTLLLFSFPLFFGDQNANHPPYPGEYESKGNVSPQYSKAADEALYWITLLDQLAYGASWGEGGSLLKDVITRDQWVAAMKAIRRPLGVVNTRKVEAHQVFKTLPYGTDGYFMQIIYRTSFNAKSSATEKCMLMFEDDQVWRVISYTVE